MLVIFLLEGGENVANEDNLKGHGFHERTASEQREIAKKAGKASGKSRRKKADLKKAFETLLVLDVTDEKIKQQLEDMGMAGNNEALLAFATFQQAVKGNQKATENIIKLTNTKDKYDIQEQRERIKALKLENKERESQNEVVDEQIIIADSWRGEDETGEHTS